MDLTTDIYKASSKGFQGLERFYFWTRMLLSKYNGLLHIYFIPNYFSSLHLWKSTGILLEQGEMR